MGEELNLAKFSLKLIEYLSKDEENDLLISSEKIYNNRLKICRSCSKFDKKNQECLECGCNIPDKAKFILDSCPLNKWTMSNEEWESIFQNIINDMKIDD